MKNDDENSLTEMHDSQSALHAYDLIQHLISQLKLFFKVVAFSVVVKDSATPT